MAFPNLQTWFAAEITMKDKAGGSTKTFYVSSRAAINDPNYGRYKPILQSISGLGMTLGNDLPEASRGSITVDNTGGSYGLERRISDFFERFTPIQQSVKIFSALTSLSDRQLSGRLVQEWQGVTRSFRIGYGEDGKGTVTFEIESSSILNRIMTRAITAAEFQAAPQASIGRHLPLVFGYNVETKPVRITADAAYPVQWAYGTTLGQTNVNSGVITYWGKANDGNYRPLSNPPTVNTPIVSTNTAGNIKGRDGTLASIPKEFAHCMLPDTLVPYVVTTGRIYVYGVGFGAYSAAGSIFINIYERKKTSGAPGDKIASAEILKSTYATALRGSAGFFMDFSFSKPWMLGFSDTVYGYFVSFSQTYPTTGIEDDEVVAPGFVPGTFPLDSAYQITNRAATRGINDFDLVTSGNIRMLYDLFAVRFDDFRTPTLGMIGEDGLGYSYIEATQRTAGTGQTNTDISGLDLILGVHGLKDDAAGLVTGTPNAPIEAAHFAAYAAARTYAGSGVWSDTTAFDFTAFDASEAVFQSTHRYYRKIAGTTDGRTTLETVLRNILKNAAAQIVMRKNGKFSVYSWGTERPTAARIDESDGARILSINKESAAYVINKIIAYYDRRLTTSDLITGTAEAEFRNYAGSMTLSTANDALVDLYSRESVSSYGTRELSQNTFNYLSDTDSMRHVLESFLTQWGEPPVFVDVEAPFFKFRALELLDVVEILHPDLPSYFGTSEDALLPTYNGAQIDVVDGQPWRRAKNYRAIIEAIGINWTFTEVPTLRLTTRLLLNSPKDPT